MNRPSPAPEPLRLPSEVEALVREAAAATDQEPADFLATLAVETIARQRLPFLAAYPNARQALLVSINHAKAEFQADMACQSAATLARWEAERQAAKAAAEG